MSNKTKSKTTIASAADADDAAELGAPVVEVEAFRAKLAEQSEQYESMMVSMRKVVRMKKVNG